MNLLQLEGELAFSWLAPEPARGPRLPLVLEVGLQPVHYPLQNLAHSGNRRPWQAVSKVVNASRPVWQSEMACAPIRCSGGSGPVAWFTHSSLSHSK